MEHLKPFLLWCFTPLAAINFLEIAVDPVEDIQEVGKLLVQIGLAIYGLFKLWQDNKRKK